MLSERNMLCLLRLKDAPACRDREIAWPGSKAHFPDGFEA